MRKKFISVCATAVLALCCAFAAACGGGAKIADNTEHFDDITKTLRLTKSYDGKTLMTEGGGGIEEAELIGDTTDGDTSNFRLKSGDSIAVRYQGVDTPESTAGVEKWGKAASKFTNEQLQSATTIVIESANIGHPPKKDSVGQRPLCYVWYKTADSDFKLLNLELVENGYSKNKEAADNGYYSYFQKAEEFARSIKLRLFSDLDDPLYDTNAKDISLKEIKEHPENLKESTMVRLQAYVTGHTISGGGAHTFEIAQYDETENKEYKLNLYAGYNGAVTSMRVGDLYHIVGTLQKHDGAWQISGVTLDNDLKGKEDKSWRAQLSYYLTFNASHSYYLSGESGNCYGNVKVTQVIGLDGNVLTFTGTAPKTKTAEPVPFTFTVTVPDGYNNEIETGKTLSISSGYQFVEGSGEVSIPSYSNITIK